MKHLITSLVLTCMFNVKASAQQYLNWVATAGTFHIEKANSMVVDKSGNVYHTGYFATAIDIDPGTGVANLNTNGLNDFYLSKYDSDGSFIWAFSLGGTTNDGGNKLALDDSGNIYVTGWFGATVDFNPGPMVDTLSGGAMDMFFAKYDSTGAFKWAKKIGAPNGYDQYMQISVGRSGNLYLSGEYSYANTDFDPGLGQVFLTTNVGPGSTAFIAKYDNSGNYIWANSFHRSSSSMANVGIDDLSLDSLENIYICGNFNDTVDFDPGPDSTYLMPIGTNIFFAKYDSSCAFAWANKLVSGYFDQAKALAVDASGDVYICGNVVYGVDFDPGPGTSIMQAYGDDGFVAHYDTDGNFVFVTTVGGTNIYPSHQYVNDIILDPSNNIYVCGWFIGTIVFGADTSYGVGNTYPQDMFFAKYSSTGTLAFGKTIRGTGPEEVLSMALDAGNNVYLCGSFQDTIDFAPNIDVLERISMGYSDLFVAKYGDSILLSVSEIPKNASEIIVFPNPVKAVLSVRCPEEIQSISVSDILGRIISHTNSSEIDMSAYSPGMYLLRIKTEQDIFFSKVIKE